MASKAPKKKSNEDRLKQLVPLLSQLSLLHNSIHNFQEFSSIDNQDNEISINVDDKYR